MNEDGVFIFIHVEENVPGASLFFLPLGLRRFSASEMPRHTNNTPRRTRANVECETWGSLAVRKARRSFNYHYRMTRKLRLDPRASTKGASLLFSFPFLTLNGNASLP